MKKLILSLLIAIMAIPAFAGTKLVTGSLADLKGGKTVPFIVNWDNAVYSKAGTLVDFLDKAVRNNDWERESLNYLIQKVNSRTGEYGVRLSDKDTNTDSEYYFEMEVATISKGGDITGEILLKKKGQEDPVAILSFKSDDADNNDKIAFRDQFKSIGQSLGKLIVKQLNCK